MDRNALSACGDSAAAAQAAKAAYAAKAPTADRELDTTEVSSLVGAAKSIADEIVNAAPQGAHARRRSLVIDTREVCALQVIDGSRAAELLNKDPHVFGAAVKRLYLSGPAGEAELRELLAPVDRMDADKPPPRVLFGVGKPLFGGPG